MNIQFTKMHGLGNDFVVIDNFNGNIELSPELIKFLCHRREGIGADGVILVENYPNADAFMNYYNADGSQSEMCGNGIRSVAKFLQDDYLKNKTNFKIHTRAGLKEVEALGDGTYSVNMGAPVFEHADFPKESMKLEGLDLNFVSVGNPHAVAFVENFADYDLSKIGPKIENDKVFPNKINFELVKQNSSHEFDVQVWERGCGETMACGTGACAVYALARRQKGAEEKIIISLRGGNLYMSQNASGDIIMRGPAESVYNGMIYVRNKEEKE